MKTKINLLAICFLLAGMSLIPQVAHAQVLLPPFTAASISGSYGYMISGAIFNERIQPIPNTTVPNLYAQVGELVFDGKGGFTNSFDVDEVSLIEGYTVDNRGQVTQGSYFFSDPTSPVATLIFHGKPLPCVFISAAFNTPPPFNATGLGILPLTPPLGSQSPKGPLGAPVAGPSFLPSDAALSCTDTDGEVFAGKPPIPIPPALRGTPDGTSFGSFGFPISTFTGVMTQQ